MHERQRIPPALFRLAQVQGGVASRAQVMGLGMSGKAIRRLLLDGTWGRLDPGIYLVPDVQPTWLSRVWAGLLIGGDQARAGGRAAAALQGLVDGEPVPIEILVPVGVRLGARDWVTFRQERPGVRSISTRTEPPCTRVEDTVLDLCAEGSETGCVDWITTAVQRRLTTPDALTRALQRRTRMPHRKFLTAVIDDAADGVHSTLEYRYRHDVELAHHLPHGRRQKPGPGEFLDVLYEDYAVIVELDGQVGHVGAGRFRDRRRDNRHTKGNAKTLRYGWVEVNDDPCDTAWEVGELLAGRGWSGYPAKCPRCLR